MGANISSSFSRRQDTCRHEFANPMVFGVADIDRAFGTDGDTVRPGELGGERGAAIARGTEAAGSDEDGD